MDTQLDPTEAVLAVIGVNPLITKEVEKFTKEQLDQVEALPRKIERMARQLAQGEIEAVPLFDMSYDKVLRDLYDEYQPDQVEAMARAMEKWAPGVTVGLLAKAKEVVDYLGSIFPRSSYQTFLGSANVVPSDVAIYQFESVLEVLQDPLKVFSLISQGAITKRQVDAVHMVYPTVSALIDEAITNAALDAKTAKASYQLPPGAEIGVRKWFGQPAIDPKTSAQLQAMASKPPEKPSPVPASKTPKSSALAKESMSAAQRAALGPIT